MKRLVSRKTTEKHTKKYKDSTRSHVGLILKDYKEHKIKMECKRIGFFEKIICFRGRESKSKTWKCKDRMKQDCYYTRRTFIETITKKWENNFDRYD